MDIVFVFLTVIFLLKLLWNIMIPFSAGIKHKSWKEKRLATQSSISLTPIIEIFIMFVLVVISASFGVNILGISTFFVFLCGVGLCAASYVLIWLEVILLKHKKTKSD